MNAKGKWTVLIVALCLLGQIALYACPSPPTGNEPTQETASEATEPSSEKAPADGGAEPTQETIPEVAPEPVQEAPAKMAWSQETVEQSFIAGVDHTMELPAITGGKGTISYKLDGTPEGVTLQDKSLAIRLPYDQDKPLSVTITAEDEDKQQAQLTITLTSLSPKWTKLPDTSGPPGRANPALALAGQRLLVLGGYTSGSEGSNDLWIFDRNAKTWSQAKATGDLPPKAGVFRWAVTKTTDDGKEVTGIVLQGMIGQSGALDATYRFVLKDNDVTWTKLTTEGDFPKGLVIGTCGYDPKTRTLFAFGGLYPSSSTVDSSLYTILINNDKAIWKEQTAKGPEGRFGAQFAMDQANGLFYVASGTGTSGPLTDLWVLNVRSDEFTWTEIKTKNKLLGRQNGALFVDQKHHRVFVWGGSAQGVAPLSVFVVNTKDKEPSWVEIATPTNLDGRTSTYSIADPATGENFMGFGRAPAFLKDVWSFEPNPTE